MARVVVIESPQHRNCLAADMADYIARIPPRFESVIDLVAALQSAPFERDSGFEGSATDTACLPPQRSRIWPSSFNCWEATAHFAAEAARLLPEQWMILIQDKQIGNYRHVWPTLAFSGKLAPPIGNAANEWYNDLFGGIHFVGDKVLRFFGGGAISDLIAEKAGDALPDWARTPEQVAVHEKQNIEVEVKPTPQSEPVKIQVQVPTAVEAKPTEAVAKAVSPSIRIGLDDLI